MKRLTIGILAHVDSGKTTLSEALLYNSGELRTLGRVDKGNAFLDTHALEKSRGITIFSKQAVMNYKDAYITLLDTPGHTDFSAEAERVLQVLDYAVLVISGSEGVQSHTETLWGMLRRHNIPTFIFINKTDISHFTHEELMQGLCRRISPACVDFSGDFYENAAMCDNTLMEIFLDSGEIPDDYIKSAVRMGKIFPCLFGSALKNEGVTELLDTICRYTAAPVYGEKFAARVFKISEDEQKNRLTFMKITGGQLSVRDVIGEEKVNAVRIYSGAKFQPIETAEAGVVCAVTGLSAAHPGERLGAESGEEIMQTEPVLCYRAIPEDGADLLKTYLTIKKLADEDPQLNITWDEAVREIHIYIMGEIQLEILRSIIADRFGIKLRFDSGSIAYKETIADKVEGVGHFEPLRHYAEVHLILQPLPQGSGLIFESECREDKLSKNWQRLILTHLQEKVHVGVLTGSPITDMKITLASGKAHLKHTEGGDFRQATYRAVRQGLMTAESVLLEPWYSFTLEVPSDCIGRAMTDIDKMGGTSEPPESQGDMSVLKGSAPVSEIRTYQTEVLSYTRGLGRISLSFKGYFPCHNSEEVIAAKGYDAERDMSNSPDSVFCANGAGFVVKWNEVPQHMHLESVLNPAVTVEAATHIVRKAQPQDAYALEKELMEIFERTYGKINRDKRTAMRREPEYNPKKLKSTPVPTGPEYLLVDGYNIIFAWDELKKAAADNLDLARSMLINALCNYRGFRQCNLILVFDAYRVKGGKERVEQIDGITVVYTKEAETADTFIERTAHDISKNHRVRVATSDNLEQIIILGVGAYRVSASEFHEEVKRTEEEIRNFIN